MAAKPFFEILVDQIRKDVHSELRAEIEQDPNVALERASGAHSLPSPESLRAEQLETWLSLQMSQFQIPQTFKPKKGYHSERNARQRPHSGPTAKGVLQPEIAITTAHHLIALETLCRASGQATVNKLTESELKALWRMAARKTHPDAFFGLDAQTTNKKAAEFRELKAAYEEILTLFSEAA